MVTVGMNYRVKRGREDAFERVFSGIVETLREVPAHVSTRLYRACDGAADYLILSEWTGREAFDEFIGSGAFRRVTSWGLDGILRDRPSHEVFEKGEEPEARVSPRTAGCPVSHAS